MEKITENEIAKHEHEMNTGEQELFDAYMRREKESARELLVANEVLKRMGLNFTTMALSYVAMKLLLESERRTGEKMRMEDIG